MLFMTALTPYSSPVYKAMLANQAIFGRFYNDPRNCQNVELWENWCLDNGAFYSHLNGRQFDDLRFLRSVERLIHYKKTCRFVVVPDVPFDWQSTLAKFCDWHNTIKRLGFPRAIAVQDGATVDDVPWCNIEAIFIGGSTRWKREHYADLPLFCHVKTDRDKIVAEARSRGLWVHFGRQANSRRQLVQAYKMGACSVDGTGETRAPNKEFMWISQTMWQIQQGMV